jgi:transposase
MEIDVKAHRRIIRRRRYKPTCRCGAVPGIVTAPPAPKLIPKGIFGVSVWVTILLDKFQFLRPTHRLLADLKTHGLDISQGTITDGLKTIPPLFDPLYEAIIAKNLGENRWHADETRWPVFAIVEGEVGYGWYMWVFCSASTVVYTLDPRRSSEVPKAHFGLEAALFSIFQTLCLWNINCRLWLTAFLEACAENQGKAPEDIKSFLPWNMSKEQRKAFSLKPEIEDSS